MKAKDMALGGLLCALTIIILYLTYLFPTNTLTLLTLASFMVPLALIRGNIRTAILVYVCSTLLTLILLPPNIFIMYGLFFGGYGLIKYFVEYVDKPAVEWLLKFIFFNTVFLLGLNTFITFISPTMLDQINHIVEQFLPNIPYGGSILILLLAQVAFAIFDYALTLLIGMYYKYFGR